MAKLVIVGVGPGSPDYVTPAARKVVREAYVVVGAQRSVNLFSDEINGETIVLTAKNLLESLKKAAQAVRDGKTVALLSTGDPGFSGLLHTVLESGLIPKEDITVVPGVSSIQACAARLNLSWDNARLFTFHEGDVSNDQKGKLVSAFQCGYDILLLPAQKDFAPKDIAALLLETGADKQTQVYICEKLTLENEKVSLTTLEKVASQSYGALCVMVIKHPLS